MSFKEQLKEEAKTERRKLKEMPRKDILWYIWEYYKFHMLGAALAILFIGVVATSIYNSTFTTELHCIIINNRSTEDLDVTPIEQDFRSYMNFGKKQNIYTESMYIAYGNDATQYSMASMMKISALVASSDLDMFLADVENTDHYALMDGLADLEALLPADILDVVSDRLYRAKNDAGQESAVALDISGTEFAEKMHLSKEASYLSILSNSQNTDNTVALIRYIFQL